MSVFSVSVLVWFAGFFGWVHWRMAWSVVYGAREVGGIDWRCLDWGDAVATAAVAHVTGLVVYVSYLLLPGGVVGVAVVVGGGFWAVFNTGWVAASIAVSGSDLRNGRYDEWKRLQASDNPV